MVTLTPARAARPRMAPRQPQVSSMAWARGATRKVPTPAAHSTTLVARLLRHHVISNHCIIDSKNTTCLCLWVKYLGTMTTLGR